MSKYKWRDLIQLNSTENAYLSPLAVLSHIDVNAFFAQVEEVRCGYTKNDPVVCVQWNSIIAVSYAARKYGISRMDTIQEALKKSDKIIPIHTAVFRKGEDFWQYHDGWGSWVADKDKQLPNSLYKVSLDPYRRESRKIFKIFTEYCDLAEKASVDEVFLDLGRLCLQRLFFSDQIIDGQTNESDFVKIQETFTAGKYHLDAYLPEVPKSLKSLKIAGTVYNSDGQTPIHDWDDVLFALASQITQEIRNHIEATLGYTTSCGIAKTKTVCKLASNYRKPNAQTIILNSCVESFLDCGNFEITSFWSLGGLLGKELIEILETPIPGSIKFIRDKWPSSYHELKEYLDKKAIEVKNGKKVNAIIDPSKTGMLAEKIFGIVRGDYRSPVTPQTMVKSMMSNKNMNGESCKSLIDCISWLEVFSGELSSRLHELEQEYNKVVIPRTVSILVRCKSGESHSKSGPLVRTSSKIDSQCLLKLGSKLVAELDSRFGKDPKYYPLQNINMSISHFEVLTLRKSVIDMFGAQAQVFETPNLQTNELKTVNQEQEKLDQSAEEEYECRECRLTFKENKAFQEHRDYHLALRLSESLNGAGENSKNLSVGEKRLLFAKRDSSLPKEECQSKRFKTKENGSVNKKATNTKNTQSGSTGNILTYFSRQ